MKRFIFLLTFLTSTTSFAQNYISPFDFPLYLSGTFGELRDHHFHTGIDVKTNAEEGSVQLYNKVKDKLETQGMWQEMLNGTDRYYAAVLLPNGNYGLVNLKAASFTQAEVQDLYTEIINKAQAVQKENVSSLLVSVVALKKRLKRL